MEAQPPDAPAHARSPAVASAPSASAPKNWHKYCQPCRRYFVDEHGFLGHLKGKKHAAALKRYPDTFNPGTALLGPKVVPLKPSQQHVLNQSKTPSPIKKSPSPNKNKKKKKIPTQPIPSQRAILPQRCHLCEIDLPDNNFALAIHLESREHGEKICSTPLVVRCTACTSNRMLFSDWESHRCPGKTKWSAIIDCYVSEKCVQLKKWYPHSRGATYQNHLRRFSNHFMRSCAPCGNVLVLPHCWHLHENSVEHYTALAIRDPQRKPIFFSDFVE